jgi:hypothetical protein
MPCSNYFPLLIRHLYCSTPLINQHRRRLFVSHLFIPSFLHSHSLYTRLGATRRSQVSCSHSHFALPHSPPSYYPHCPPRPLSSYILFSTCDQPALAAVSCSHHQIYELSNMCLIIRLNPTHAPAPPVFAHSRHYHRPDTVGTRQPRSGKAVRLSWRSDEVTEPVSRMALA